MLFDGRLNKSVGQTVYLPEMWDAMYVILVPIPLLLPLVSTETVGHSSPYIILYVFSVSSYLYVILLIQKKPKQLVDAFG